MHRWKWGLDVVESNMLCGTGPPCVVGWEQPAGAGPSRLLDGEWVLFRAGQRQRQPLLTNFYIEL